MSADISSVPPLPLMQDGGDRRRAQAAQEDERRPPRARPGAALIAPPGQSGIDGRLLIEEDKATGDFVYRIVDQKTGEILRQWPREEVLRMRRTDRAIPGAILDRKV